MTEPTLSALAWSEYDFAQIDSKLSDLARDLDACTAELPTVAAALRVRQARRHLRRTLALLDDEISSAVQAAARLTPPPF